ncbi:DNA methyltransferase [Bradyrhizobium japonicum]|uniref:DNA methyltransferase n=1 Tax=Bradyrhizobium japonicum TaxID=375 RepID=UPI000401D34C|nr:DNA methyltransferase [Bradyrhizobium japonicum]
MGKLADYRQFLRAKVRLASRHGFDVDASEINPALKDFVQAIVRWAASGGRRGIFSSFGLHKTSAQIELARLALKRGARPLIVVPLGVRHEFTEEAAVRFTGEFAVNLVFVRSTSELDLARTDVIYLTNYESVRESKLDLNLFGFASLDEAAVLRGFGGTKTFREFMRLFENVKWRFVATATPDPNEFIELLAYAAFLGVMDVGEAKTRFFKRNSEKADKLVIHPHKEREFWLWVASWALFVRRPSDLGFSDEGYTLPAVDVRWHEVASDHATAGHERDGQGRMFRNAAAGVQDAAREKRESLPARIAKMQALRAEAPEAHRILWHDLEAERHAIQAAVPDARAIFGSQDLETNEKHAVDFKHGRFRELATKPEMSGAGCNFQMHCSWAIFLGIGFKFHDFIQAVHRLARFGQTQRVRLDLIYTEAEREIRRTLERRWQQHDRQAEIMSGIIRQFGLTQASLASALDRSIGVERTEAEGVSYRLVNNDCVEEVSSMPADSVDLIVTSIPFSTQYEYTPSYNDFGHTDDNDHFWRQMDFLTPQLLRVLEPGRVAAIHVKDRIVPGGINGLGFQTVQPFSDECVTHFRKHGFAFLARKTIVTDVVRENNQTYRLGWTEQCKDGSRMGAGMPEYVLLFRKPPTDRSNGYADVPVVKEKPLCDDHGEPAPFDARTNWKKPVPGTGYSRARWQLDAHGFTKSSGDRLLSSEELATLPHDQIYKLWRDRSAGRVYDFASHLAVTEDMDHAQRLPSTFMLMPPHSAHPDVWTDVARMRTLNGAQSATGREMHLCPLQFDIVDRLVIQLSMEGETVLDPFAGIGTVPYCAVKLGRFGLGVELNTAYWRDSVRYAQDAEANASVPTLFDLLDEAAE